MAGPLLGPAQTEGQPGVNVRQEICSTLAKSLRGVWTDPTKTRLETLPPSASVGNATLRLRPTVHKFTSKDTLHLEINARDYSSLKFVI